jgi:hypothetical protein
MANPASSLFIALVLLVGSASAFAEAMPRQCGYDRWPVKILADKDGVRVDFKPIDTTVSKLVAIPIHEVAYSYDRRLGPEEFHVYRLRAKLISVKREQDSDLHMIVADMDNPKVRMIVEIPAPECAEGTGHESDYRKARTNLSRIPTGSTVEIVGVGFFDFLHSSSGQAKNGIELHPVLKITAIDS